MSILDYNILIVFNKSTATGDLNIHPWDSTVNLSVHQPLYPPGRVIHIVRQYPRITPDPENKNERETVNKRYVIQFLFDQTLFPKNPT